MENNKILPIGTVLTLNGENKKLMIIGYFPRKVDDGAVYDYLGCLYPEGYIDKKRNYLFNYENINVIHCIGFKSQESTIFFDNVIRNFKR